MMDFWDIPKMRNVYFQSLSLPIGAKVSADMRGRA